MNQPLFYLILSHILPLNIFWSVGFLQLTPALSFPNPGAVIPFLWYLPFHLHSQGQHSTLAGDTNILLTAIHVFTFPSLQSILHTPAD